MNIDNSDNNGVTNNKFAISEIIQPTGAGDISTLLNKFSLRPCPEYRKKFIQKLITVINSDKKPDSMVEIKHILAEKLQISRSMVQDLLNAVVRIGCLLDEEGNPTYSFTSPFRCLISSKPEIIEKKCIENYAYNLLKTDNNFFKNKNNIKNFEEVVGGKAPSPEVIDMLLKSMGNGARE